MKAIMHPLAERFRAMRFMQLTFFLVLGFIMGAFFDKGNPALIFQAFFNFNALLVAFSATNTKAHTKYILIALCGFFVAVELIQGGVYNVGIYFLSELIILLVLVFCIFKISNYVFFKKKITADSLFAIVAVYLMIAALFSQIYSLIHFFIPSSIVFPESLLDTENRLPDVTYTYFSFVTLATLGYGDILPRHPIMQVLASIEAVIGQFYVAVVVARLMSLYVAEKRKVVE